MAWLIAERPGQAASAQEQNSHQHRIYESQHPPRWSTRFASSSGSSARESQIQGAAENDNQLAMLFRFQGTK